MSELHVWKIEDAETFWVVAASKEDAVALLSEQSLLEDYALPDEFIASSKCHVQQLPDDCPLMCTIEDGPEKETRTCAEWAKDGRGLIGSTVY